VTAELAVTGEIEARGQAAHVARAEIAGLDRVAVGPTSLRRKASPWAGPSFALATR